ncbi:VOC family protein [Mumia sp. zg.B53]|uniref:VOC family protein n=1 Tax=unclassified Mumia TaxID=2621872 RepID=UPI001C6E6990|nr:MULTISPECIES: VOC family protein [unclassified Mumia]MBW9205051.1 VOC family protein [Mumia sp. zg.B17]MBW9213557.1 VOC family protein [Mumia sp. zg.B53]
MSDYPQLQTSVLDSTIPRELAEFYRNLLGLDYRAGDEPGADDDGQPDWLVLVDESGHRVLSFQKVEKLTRTTWPKDDVPMQLHLDFTVPDAAALHRHRERAEALGAELILDRSDDPDEALFVFADLSGHPFCIFVA